MLSFPAITSLSYLRIVLLQCRADVKAARGPSLQNDVTLHRQQFFIMRTRLYRYDKSCYMTTEASR